MILQNIFDVRILGSKKNLSASAPRKLKIHIKRVDNVTYHITFPYYWQHSLYI